MKKIIFLLFTATLFLATACDKDDDLQCDRTSTNHDILCCKINGEDWTPDGGGSDIISPTDLQFYSDDGGLSLLARNSNSNRALKGALYMIAVVEKLNDITFLVDNNSSLTHISDSNSSTGCSKYKDLDTTFSNFIRVLEVDSVNYIMMGEFQFSAINDCQDTIKVTEGYFDLNYFF